MTNVTGIGRELAYNESILHGGNDMKNLKLASTLVGVFAVGCVVYDFITFIFG